MVALGSLASVEPAAKPAAAPPAAPAAAAGGGGLGALAVGDQQLDLAADELLVLLERDALLQGDEPVVAVLDDLLRHLVGHRRRGRPGPDRVLEGECRGEPGGLDHAQGLLEVLLRLAGEADDDVGADRGVRQLGAHPVEDAEELLRAVGPAHGAQDAVGAGLQRHVQLRHDVRGLRHRVDHVVGERRRVRAGEADALEPADLARGAQQLAERPTVAELDAVGVDVLAEQGDLDRAVVDQGLDLGQDVAGAAVLLLAAQRRDDAEGAGVVAADRDRHPARVRGVALGGERGGEGLQRLEDLDLGGVVVPRALEQAGKRAHVVRAEDDVHPRRLLQDDVLVLLGEAAADGDLHPLVAPLDAGEVAEIAVELVVRVLAHGARVDDDDVRLRTVGGHVTGRLQGTAQPLGVVHVHLAPERAHLVRPGPPVRRDRRGGRLDDAALFDDAHDADNSTFAFPRARTGIAPSRTRRSPPPAGTLLEAHAATATRREGDVHRLAHDAGPVALACEEAVQTTPRGLVVV